VPVSFDVAEDGLDVDRVLLSKLASVCLWQHKSEQGDADDNPYQTRRLGRGRKCIHMRKREELLSSISATTRVVRQ
jgi:hypothetical protein